MEAAPSRPPDTPIEAGAVPAKRRSKKATRPQLLMRSSLDGRTNAARYFDKTLLILRPILAVVIS
jgi:hypothetical protein